MMTHLTIASLILSKFHSLMFCLLESLHLAPHRDFILKETHEYVDCYSLIYPTLMQVIPTWLAEFSSFVFYYFTFA